MKLLFVSVGAVAAMLLMLAEVELSGARSASSPAIRERRSANPEGVMDGDQVTDEELIDFIQHCNMTPEEVLKRLDDMEDMENEKSGSLRFGSEAFQNNVNSFMSRVGMTVESLADCIRRLFGVSSDEEDQTTTAASADP
ncbi:uncharacterized protein LOC122371161 [Amphibalanus amphitrite]|uniref:uncharacterized protein LOC122371161 n=1 Tax=Amphibalanus amphitrite TaxID=1232801 RepID=UPI001C900CEC|nr:uncharacterized protein LOC122371161 [Amphibalanus amphitrite]